MIRLKQQVKWASKLSGRFLSIGVLSFEQGKSFSILYLFDYKQHALIYSSFKTIFHKVKPTIVTRQFIKII